MCADASSNLFFWHDNAGMGQLVYKCFWEPAEEDSLADGGILPSCVFAVMPELRPWAGSAER